MRGTSWLAGMSPRRRVVAALVALLVVAGGVVAGIAATGGTAGGNRAGLAPVRPGPVLLVPGYGGSTGSLDTLAAHIRATGRTALVLHLPGTGTGSLITDAAALNATVDRVLAHGAPSVDVIGYSAGGVVALIWARHDDGARKARRIITLGAPFHGTSLAGAAAGLLPGACPAACQQLVPGSSLLTSLDPADPAGLPRWLALWTTDDTTVIPPDSGRLAGAVNLAIQSLCPTAQISHSELPTSPVVTAMVLQAIGTTPLRTPTAAACQGR